MGEIKAGVVVVNRFCDAGSKEFSGYISYIDRNNAKRNEKMSEYNLYNDYMENPEKTTGLFTKDKMELGKGEKKNLKSIFQHAQDNGSLMWQTVISFDNRWLEKYGLYDARQDVVDERKIKEITSNAVERMLKKEGLENAVWSGAIHYNTDNLHVHVAVVEPVPQRLKKEYVQYEYRESLSGKYVRDNYGGYVYANKDFVKKQQEEGKIVRRYDKVPLLDAEGNPVIRSQYVGTFKPKSLEACKQYVVNEIVMQRDQNFLINRIIRDQIVKSKKEHSIIQDQELVNQYLKVYRKLPRSTNRGIWNYNNNAMKQIRPELDKLSSLYMNKYNLEDYKELRRILQEQAVLYKESYGKNARDYEQAKMKDLYERLGNAILKEMKEFDKNYEGDIEELYNNQEEPMLDEIFRVETWMEEEPENGQGYIALIEEKIELPDKDWRIDYSREFKQAKEMIYGEKKDFEAALEILKDEYEGGNVLAAYEIGSLYKFGRGVEIDLGIAEQYYGRSMEMLEIMHDEVPENRKGYIAYRIGKQYFYGQGIEENPQKAFEWFKASLEEGCQFGHYNVANMYCDGKGTEKNIGDAVMHYEKACRQGNPYAAYKLAAIYKNGIGIDADQEKTENYYKNAFDGFINLEAKNHDDNLQYRIGCMYENGIGTEQDEELAEHYLSMAADVGNSNAGYRLAKIYLKRGDETYIEKAMEYLEKSAVRGKNVMAQYVLGRLAEDKSDFGSAEQWYKQASGKNSYAAYRLGKLKNNRENAGYDKEEAIKYFEASAELGNEYAAYELGKIYLEDDSYNLGKAVQWFEKSADKNIYAQYRLGKLYLDSTLTIYAPEKGMEYLEKAAKQGNEYAQLQLGLVYLQGEKKYPGIVRNKELARSYLEKAAVKNEIAKEVLTNIDRYDDRMVHGLRKPRISLRGNGAYEIERALRSLQKSMRDEVQKAINMREYEQLKEQELKEENEKNTREEVVREY